MHNVGLQERYQLLIGGQWKDASDKKTFKTICPADGSVLAECAEATREDVDEAVKAAWKAFESWKHVTVNERAVILNKIADIIDANQEHLAMVESLDNGKPIRETMAVDIPMSAQHFRYFAGCIMADEGSANMLGESTLSRSSGNPSVWWDRSCRGTSRFLWRPGNWLPCLQAGAVPCLSHPAPRP